MPSSLRDATERWAESQARIIYECSLDGQGRMIEPVWWYQRYGRRGWVKVESRRYLEAAGMVETGTRNIWKRGTEKKGGDR